MPRLWFVLFILFIACTAIASDNNGYVVGIADDDSFTILFLNNTTVDIRLHSIDTTENRQHFGGNLNLI
jgi:hypothetical protein